MMHCGSLKLELKSYALMALVCHDEMTSRKQDNGPTLDCNDKGTMPQPLLSYFEEKERFEKMHEAIQLTLTVSSLLKSVELHC